MQNARRKTCGKTTTNNRVDAAVIHDLWEAPLARPLGRAWAWACSPVSRGRPLRRARTCTAILRGRVRGAPAARAAARRARPLRPSWAGVSECGQASANATRAAGGGVQVTGRPLASWWVQKIVLPWFVRTRTDLTRPESERAPGEALRARLGPADCELRETRASSEYKRG